MAASITPPPRKEKITPQWIKRKRLSLQLTQRELARKLGTCYATVNRWEMGHYSPHPVFQRMLREL